MTLLAGYQDARGGEDIARLRRVIALRAMVALSMNQREIAAAVGIPQSAVSQQLGFGSALESVHPEVLLKAAEPVLRLLAAERGYERLAVFGSIARGEAGHHSDIDLIVDAPAGTSSFAFVRFKQLVEQIPGRDVDLISYGGLALVLDGDIRRGAVLL